MVINGTMIWFSKKKVFHSLQSICTDSTACEEDVNTTYNRMKNLKYDEIQTKLSNLLHSDQSFVANLTCSNNNDQSIQCPNGYCQLTRKGTSNIDRQCVPQSSNINPSGIMIQSNTVEEPDAEASLTYACTKPMCNGIRADEQVQNLLVQYGLLPVLNTIPVVQETTTTTTTTTTTIHTSSQPNAAMTTLHQPMMNFQWMLLLIITILLKI
ncbi:unnamed protein product [Rotaria sp. Silwood1]|nr:unnamed protein product [Rotaria sp. Silwood1]CAF1058725.1 unnamed protein product [Rotaria sp. Silwood1]CAF3416696.1 unnamed protein product [Rotaria sp. Silwood1]CAF3426065.1 unnamed protein product [Rotaria sp. Silwood1]CAF3434467.1 unnamed protein product [Rotaria sp. Silwood1]